MTAQPPEFTAELREARHPALQPRPVVRPLSMWISSGAQPEGAIQSRLEVRICPPGDSHLSETKWPHSAAVLYRSVWLGKEWAPNQFLGYLTASDARFLAKVLTDYEAYNASEAPQGGATVMEVQE